MSAPAISELVEFCTRYPRLMVLTGAGCSTASGIPAYRDDAGCWQHPPPVQYQDFLRCPGVRRRYWARSAVGWSRIARARPGPVHRALAELETDGRIDQLVTQNVDGLHQAAGSTRVTDLHGRLDRVRCLECGGDNARDAFQQELEWANPNWAPAAQAAPDGDARIPDAVYDQFTVPPCRACGGPLKPDVVFFGEPVPRARVHHAMAALGAADALLIVGSSLMVFSGFRFAREAHRRGIPIAAVNRGQTRADALLQIKHPGDCNAALPALQRLLGEPAVAEA
jgi:NAD-dependent SIR2 family protein deacetylase